MLWLLLFISEIVILFFLSRIVTKTLSIWFFSLTRSQNATIQLLSLIFFPGVVVHELSHWFMSGILFVRTGEIEFMPKIQGETVKLGSVAIAKSDPIRRFFIGVAPVIIGIASFLFFFSLVSRDVPKFNWQTILLVYGFFEIGNTMFSSSKDMEGALGLLLAIIIIGVVTFFLGFRLQFNIISFLSLQPLDLFFQRIDLLIVVPIVLDLVLWGITYTLRRKS